MRPDSIKPLVLVARIFAAPQFQFSNFPLSALLPAMADVLPPRMNYIFVDFENVHETDLDRIANRPVQVILVLGEQHKKLPVLLVKKLLQYAGQVRLVETGRSGRNAADLVLANYIGEVKKADPHGYIHILSKDTDFDALIGHHRENGTLAARHTSFSEIPVLMNVAERVQLLTARFQNGATSQPRLRKTLESQIGAFFARSLSADELEATIQGLIATKVINISTTGAVGYGASPSPGLSPAIVRVAAATPAPRAAAAPKPAAKPSAKPESKSAAKPAPKPVAPPVALTDLATAALERLRQHPDNRPKKKTKLVFFLISELGHQHHLHTIYGAIKNLRQAGHLSFVGQAVTYHF